MISVDSEPGAKVRSKIKNAAEQISNLAKGKYPGVLVLYNNVPFVLGSPLDPDNVRVGMYGFDTIVLTQPTDFDVSREVIGRKFGPKKKLTEEHNTSISALAVLEETQEGLSLSVYHNQHASIPLPLEVVRAVGAKQYVLSDDTRLEFRSWIEQ